MNATASRITAALAAGGAATYLMDLAGEKIYARQSQALKDREAEVQPKSALAVLAERLLAGAKREAAPEAVSALSTAIHWTYGAGMGVAYGFIDERFAAVSASFGAPVALLLLAFDEFGLSAMQLSPPPWKFPAGTHLRSLANHLVYGAVLAVAYRGLTHLHGERP